MKGVGVVRDKELKLEDGEASHTVVYRLAGTFRVVK